MGFCKKNPKGAAATFQQET